MTSTDYQEVSAKDAIDSNDAENAIENKGVSMSKRKHKEDEKNEE